MRQGTARRTFGAALALGAILLGSLTPVAAQGPRLVVRVNEPFEVAGRLFPAGSLSLRSMGPFNPAAMLDELWIDDECLGMFLAHKTGSNTHSATDSVLFVRNRNGRLVLTGYVLRGVGPTYEYRQALNSIAERATPLSGDPMLATR